MPADPSVYPGTGCLRNRAGIRDPEQLARIEAEQTAIRIAQLERVPLLGRYDLEHLRAFHRRIFGDIYEWAGELRFVAIAKDDSLFALPQHLETYLTQLFDELGRENLLCGRAPTSASQPRVPTTSAANSRSPIRSVPASPNARPASRSR